ncbi:hypothetical protein Ddc_05278 [Ditylenchus destructor]|nr:hypothetical protein Ddc_05278 [Ditylenchus destructor]
MMNSHHISIFKLLLYTATYILLLFALPHPIHGSENTQPDPILILLEYKNALPKEHFNKLIQIYSNQTITAMDRERAAVNYFSAALSPELKEKMPVPFGFRRLPAELQNKVKDLYYQDGISFDDKLVQIGTLLTENLPAEDLNAFVSAEQSQSKENTGLVEFRVNVTMNLNGFYTTEQLRSILSPEEFERVDNILQSDRSNQEKSYAIGYILRETYRRNSRPNNQDWPPIYGTEHLPEELRKATVHMLLNENPNRDLTPFIKVLMFSLYRSSLSTH